MFELIFSEKINNDIVSSFISQRRRARGGITKEERKGKKCFIIVL